MNYPEKGLFHPFGSTEAVVQNLQQYPPTFGVQQTRHLSIIYAKRKLQVDIPVRWTVNKVKCMLCSHFEILNFDKFEFQCNKMLIPGKTFVNNLPNDELIVTHAECIKALQKLYKKTMKKVSKKYKLSTESTAYGITHYGISDAICCNIPKGRQHNLEEVPLEANRREQQQEGVIVINIFRVIGIAIMTNLIFSFASYWQIGILFLIAGLYYLIDEHVKQNERRRKLAEREAQRRQEDQNRRAVEEQTKNKSFNKQKKQNLANNQPETNIFNDQKPQPTNPFQLNQTKRNSNTQKQFTNEYSDQPQQANYLDKTQRQIQKQELEPEMPIVQKPQRKILKAKFKLWLTCVLQAVYCYILSIFPNWTVETHLHANQKIMDNIMDQIKKLDPEASQLIKNWEIKNKQYQPNARQEQVLKED